MQAPDLAGMVVFGPDMKGIRRPTRGAHDLCKRRSLKMLRTRTLGAATMVALLFTTTAVLANDIVINNQRKEDEDKL